MSSNGLRKTSFMSSFLLLLFAPFFVMFRSRLKETSSQDAHFLLSCASPCLLTGWWSEPEIFFDTRLCLLAISRLTSKHLWTINLRSSCTHLHIWMQPCSRYCLPWPRNELIMKILVIKWLERRHFLLIIQFTLSSGIIAWKLFQV